MTKRSTERKDRTGWEKNDRTGWTRRMNNGLLATITTYKNAMCFTVLFENGYLVPAVKNIGQFEKRTVDWFSWVKLEGETLKRALKIKEEAIKTWESKHPNYDYTDDIKPIKKSGRHLCDHRKQDIEKIPIWQQLDI